MWYLMKRVKWKHVARKLGTPCSSKLNLLYYYLAISSRNYASLIGENLLWYDSKAYLTPEAKYESLWNHDTSLVQPHVQLYL